MCGIFGLAAAEQAKLSPAVVRDVLKRLYRLSESRGTEAAGLAVLSPSQIEVVKDAVPARQFVASKEYNRALKTISSESAAHGSFAAIGHSRLVTNGSQERHDNNQPVIADRCVGIHNGIIVNDAKVWQAHPELNRRYEVDTEVIFSLLGKYYSQDKSVAKAVSKTFAAIEGQASIAGFFRELNALLLATNNGSLYYVSSERTPVLVFASERQILRRLLQNPELKNIFGDGEVRHLRPGYAVLVNLETVKPQLFALSQPPENLVAPTNGVVRNVIDVLAEFNNSKPVVTPVPASVDVRWARDTYGFDTSFADSLRRCTKCILPETVPFIEFDSQGVCNYCANYRKIELFGEEALRKIADSIRRTNGEPDCLVGLSGGRDSCYGLHYIKKELGLNPVAYTFDWGMVTDLARRNISRMCGKLGVEHILVSAKIAQKRFYIKRNVEAWLKKPELGMIPLFMAGDKAYFYHASRLKKEMGLSEIFLCENMLERTDFKTGFAGVRPAHIDPNHAYTISPVSKLKLMSYYIGQYLKNPGYINESLFDSFLGFASYYIIGRDYQNLFKYIRWNEDTIISTLRREYDWELSPDTKSTWRIGDGTASFYNYIYFRIAGFTENESFRSNQIREGLIARDEALQLARAQNEPRYESIKWYCDTNGIDFRHAVKVINETPHLPRQSSGA